ncbi:hypothetical protein ACUY4R_003966 [Kosakonia sp. BK9b]
MARQLTLFKNLSVAAKLFGGFSVLLAIIILSSVGVSISYQSFAITPIKRGWSPRLAMI